MKDSYLEKVPFFCRWKNIEVVALDSLIHDINRSKGRNLCCFPILILIEAVLKKGIKEMILVGP